MVEQVIAASPWLFTLIIDQLPSHISLRDLFRHVPVLTKLTVTYGAKHLGSEYERSLFGMTMDDAASLAKLVKNAPNLIYLSLPCNMIDDDLVKMLCRGFLLNKTLIELDLSHNRIGDHGARRLAKYLFHDETLQILDLSDNQIQYDGSRCIGQALRNNSSLSVLSLKHNRLDDKSGAKLCNDLQHNHSIKVLNLSANQMSTLFCEKLAELLKEDMNTGINELDISCNKLVDPTAEDVIVEEMIASVNNLKNALQSRCIVSKLDIRNNNIPRALEREINEIVLKTELDRKQIPLYQSELPSSSESSRAQSRGSQASNARNKK